MPCLGVTGYISNRHSPIGTTEEASSCCYTKPHSCNYDNPRVYQPVDIVQTYKQWQKHYQKRGTTFLQGNSFSGTLSQDS